MNAKAFPDDLGQKIEELVRAHMTGLRSTAMAAVDRALNAEKRAAVIAKGMRLNGAPEERRRTTQELGGLADLLYAKLCEAPGETMAALAVKLGESSARLHRPMAALKRAGRARSVGERNLTRYFPMTGSRS